MPALRRPIHLSRPRRGAPGAGGPPDGAPSPGGAPNPGGGRLARAAVLAALAAGALVPGIAAPASPLEVGGTDVSIGPHASYLLDPSGSLGPEEVLARARAGGLAPFATAIRSFGPTAAAIWMHLEVSNTATGDLGFTWDRPLVDHLDLWVVRAGRVEHLRGGLGVPVADRTIRHLGPYHWASLRLGSGERVEILLRAQAGRILLAEGTLRRASAVQPRDLWLGGYLGTLAGIMAMVTFLAAWSWITLRDRWSLRLTALLATFAAYIGSEAGLLAALWDLPASIASAAPSVTAMGCAILGLAYSRAFLTSHERFPRLDRAAAWLQGAGLATILLPLVAPAAGAVVTIANVALTFSTMMLMGVWAVRTGERPARFFLASASIMSAFGAPYLLALLGLGPATALTLSGFQVALWVGGVVLLLSLLDRVDVERGAARARLEREVSERTASLRETVGRLAESEERFRVAFRTSPEAISITRLDDGAYLTVNEGFTQVTGWTETDVLGGVPPALWVDPADRERMRQHLLREGRIDNLEVRHRHREGREVVGLVSAQRITLGGQEWVLAVTRDITARKAAEAERDRLAEQLRESQKMEAVGRLAGGVAHDFNNLLTAIRTNVSLAFMDLPGDDQALPWFQEIGDAAARASQLTGQLLAFSRRQVLAPRPVDLMAHVGGMRDLLRRLLGEDVELDVAPGGGSPAVMADAHQVDQVVVNLAVNARDALPRGGRISISAGAEVVVGAAAATGERRTGRYVPLVVADDGEGMPPEVLARAFEPFFTTKKGKGTGLGLSTVYGIAAQHGGFVEADSQPGRGATFRVYFPVADAPARLAEAAGPVGPLPSGRETILLAEDEAAVRRAAAALLTRLGYRVLEARNGAEALALAGREQVAMLLSDVIMPGMNGRELAERFRALHPGAGVLLMSGYTDDVIDRSGVLDPGFRLLPKPFESAQLALAIRDVLARAGA